MDEERGRRNRPEILVVVEKMDIFLCSVSILEISGGGL